MKNKLFTLLRILISVSLIGLLIWLMRDKIPDIINTIKEADKGFLVAGISIYTFAVFIIAFRLKKVISVQEINLTSKESIYLTFIGYFFNNFLPTSFGGDILKAYYVGKKSDKKAGAFAGVFMDRILAMLPFTLIPAFVLTFMGHKVENKILVAMVYTVFFSCVGLLILLLNRKAAKFLSYCLEPFKGKIWYDKIKNGYEYLNAYARHKIVFLWSFTLSVAAQAFCILAAYFYARALGIDYVRMGIYFIVVPIVWVMTLVPSLNGLGIREGSFIYLMKDYIEPEKAFAVSILVLASLALFSAIGGVIYLLKKETFILNKEEIT